MTDITIVLISFMIGEIILIVPFAIFMRLGGYPEGLWRILRIKYFAFWIIDADNALMRHILRFSHIKTHSPSYFDYHNKRFFIDKQNTLRSRGRPAWLYLPDNAFPIPVITAERGRLIDPEKVRRAFRTEIMKAFYRIREGESKRPNYLLYALIAIFALLGLGLAFYIIK